MVRYEKDTTAPAVVLADYGVSSIDYIQGTGFVIKFERLRRVKILTKDGYDWGNFTIRLYRDGTTEEDLASIKAITYNLEKGKIVETKLRNDAIIREEADKNIRNVKIALPNVREGSVIEISYKVTSPFLFNFQDWDFQSTIPIVWGEYRAHIPEYFEYKKLMQGYLALSISESSEVKRSFELVYREKIGGGNTSTRFGGSSGNTERERVEYTEKYFRWALKDAPAFREEPFLTTYRDYISNLHFELSSMQMPNQPIKYFNNSWEGLGRDFLDNSSFGGVISGSGFLKDHIEKATTGKSDPKEIIAGIYNYVKENVLWNGQYRKYSDENLKRVMENKRGSSAEINLMLISMLQKANIKAAPVLISTRNHGFIRKDNPISSQFNYVIAAVDLEGKLLLLDATDRSLPLNVLPERCLNGEGFMIRPDKSEWIKINPIKSRTTVSSDLTLSAAGEFKGKIQFTHDGYYAQNVRKKFFKDGKEGYVKDLASSYAWNISSSEFENMDKLGETVKEIHQLQINDNIQANGDHMYFNPIMVMRVDENPFQLEKREYPVDFGSPEEKIFVARITLPKDWTVEELPKPKALVLPGGVAKCIYTVTQNGNVLSVTSQLVINKALFSQDEYPGLRDFYGQVVAKQAELVVLKKN